MGKKIVTAKEQFKKRLSELSQLYVQVTKEYDEFYLCENKNNEMSILFYIKSADVYMEYEYEGSVRSLLDSEEFLEEMVARFVDSHNVKPLFDWYASADRNEYPFTLYDITQCDLEIEEMTVEFKDMEVECEEPFANERKVAFRDIDERKAELEYEGDNGNYYTAEVDGKFQVICIWDESAPTKYAFAESREALYKSIVFQNAMMMYLALDRDQEEVSKFAEWIKGSLEPEPFDVYDIIEALRFAEGLAIVEEYKFEEEEDVNISPVNEVRTKLLQAIRKKYEKGYVVDNEKLVIRHRIATVGGESYSLECFDIYIYEGHGGLLGFSVSSIDEPINLKSMQYRKNSTSVGDLHLLCVEHLYEILQAMVLPE